MNIQTTCLSLWDLAISRQWGGSVGAKSPNLSLILNLLLTPDLYLSVHTCYPTSTPESAIMILFTAFFQYSKKNHFFCCCRLCLNVSSSPFSLLLQRRFHCLISRFLLPCQNIFARFPFFLKKRKKFQIFFHPSCFLIRGDSI